MVYYGEKLPFVKNSKRDRQWRPYVTKNWSLSVCVLNERACYYLCEIRLNKKSTDQIGGTKLGQAKSSAKPTN